MARAKKVSIMNKPESSVHSSDLLACPFCGYEDCMNGKDHRGYDRIACPNCGAEGPIDQDAWGLESDQGEHGPNLWNRRASVKANTKLTTPKDVVE